MSEVHNTDTHITKMKQQKWITGSLKQEMLDLSPKEADKIHSEDSDEINYNSSSFCLASSKLFFKHQEFVNILQLNEVTR